MLLGSLQPVGHQRSLLVSCLIVVPSLHFRWQYMCIYPHSLEPVSCCYDLWATYMHTGSGTGSTHQVPTWASLSGSWMMTSCLRVWTGEVQVLTGR